MTGRDMRSEDSSTDVSGSSKGVPRAFVIMDFGDEFTSIYDDLYKATLENIGYAVSRSDTQYQGSSIMARIVIDIEQSDLLIADLTGTNPNVYYELGLAHAMGKPTVLFMQNLEELPFDLRPYHVIQYSTRYNEFGKAQDRLRDIAQRFLDRDVEFSNPHADALKLTVPAYKESNIDYSRRTTETPKPPDTTTTYSIDASNNPPQENQKNHDVLDNDSNNGTMTLDDSDDADDDESLESLDHLAKLEDGFIGFATVTNEIGNKTGLLNDRILLATNELQSNQSNSARDMRVIILRLAKDIDNFANFLGSANEEYEKNIRQVQAATPNAFATLTISTSGDREKIQAVLETVESVENSVRTYQSSIDEMAMVLDSIPLVVRNLTRARRRLSTQLTRLSGNIADILSVLADTRRIFQGKLEEEQE